MDCHTSCGLRQPLRFHRIPFEKVWGGRALERTPGIELSLDGPVGETWELVDRVDHNSIVACGELQGESLRSLMLGRGGELLGRARPAAGGAFPVLVKLLDASDVLSVQVHPDDEVARRLGDGETGKTEAWYILSAEPGSRIWLGLKPGVDRAAFEREAGGPGVVDLLQTYEVSPGQLYFVPSGTVHAIGAGITLAEVQQNSDVTYRVYDWGRVGLDGQPRATHLEETLESVSYDRPWVGPVQAGAEPGPGACGRAELLECDHFALSALVLRGGGDNDTVERAMVYLATRGAGRLTVPGTEGEWRIRPGDTWLLPAGVGRHRIEPDGEGLRLLEVRLR